MAHVAILGARELIKYFHDEAKKVTQKKKQAMKDACELVVSEAKRSMVQTKKTTDEARAWKKGKGKGAKLHFPSEPGHPPAVDESNLIKSVGYQIRTGSKGEVIGEPGSRNVPYAAALEYGRLDGSIAPRPWLRPALTRSTEKVTKIFEKVLKG